MADIEVIPANQLTIDQHVERIRNALDRARSAIFDLVDTIKAAHDQLGGDVFQSELAERLGMSASTLSRWLQIGNSQFLIAQQARLPSTFSSLYDLTRLEKIYVEQYGPTEAERRLVKLLEDGKVSPTSERSDIQALLKSIDDRLKKKAKKEREQRIIDLAGRNELPASDKVSLSDLLEQGSIFRTFVAVPPRELLSKWGDDGILEIDIADQFPVANLRAPSMSEVVTCFISVPANQVDAGLKILGAFGFTYRDMFIPNIKGDGLTLIKSETITLRGERGIGKTPPLTSMASSGLDDLLSFAEEVGAGPHLLLFDTTERTSWTCLINQ